MTKHKCKENTTRNEVWTYSGYAILTLVGGTETCHFEHNERIRYCPYCGKDLRKEINDD